MVSTAVGGWGLQCRIWVTVAEQAARARWLVKGTDREVARHLNDMAQDYEELAAEIEADTMEVRVPICYRRNNSNLNEAHC